jgi:hypothetical protein
VDLRTGIARHQAELLGLWPDPAPPEAGGLPTFPGPGRSPENDVRAPVTRKRGGRKQRE